MKTFLIRSFTYNGIGVSMKQLKEKLPVTILGVTKPVDPGFVTIDNNGVTQQVPTWVLEECPDIDFEALLTPTQIEQRKKFSFLFGRGSDEPEVFVPLAECPINA